MWGIQGREGRERRRGGVEKGVKNEKRESGRE